MSTASFTSAADGGHRAHGATALSTTDDGRLGHPRHRLGDALRAARVFGRVAAEVVLLGRIEERPPRGPGTEDPPPPSPTLPPPPSPPGAIPPGRPPEPR